MRIGIEGKVLTPEIGGIGRYAVNLVKALLSISAEEHPEMVPRFIVPLVYHETARSWLGLSVRRRLARV